METRIEFVQPAKIINPLIIIISIRIRPSRNKVQISHDENEYE